MPAAKVFDLSVILTAIDNLSKPLNKASQSVIGFQKKTARVSKQMKSVGDKLTKNITLPLAGIGLISSRTFMKFDDSMKAVQARTGATGEELKRLTDAAKTMGKTTRFRASEAAEGMNFLAMAGFDTNKIIGAMPAMLDLAAASSMGLAQASDMTSDIMSQFSIKASEASRVADVLAKTSNRTNTDVSQMFEAFKFAGPVFAGLGVSLEETSTIIGLLAEKGLKGGMATRALTTAFTKLSKPSKDALRIMEDFGVKAFDEQTGEFKGLVDILGQVENATKKMTPEQALYFKTTLFGSESLKAVNALLDTNKKIMVDGKMETLKGVDALKGFNKELNDSAGFSKKTAKIMESGFGGAMRKTMSALEGMAITLGEILAPMITKVAEKIQKFTQWFDKLSPSTKKLIVKIAMLAAALGPVLIILGNLVGAISAVSGAIAFLLANPIVLIVVGIIAALTGLVILFIKLEKRTKIFSRTLNYLKRLFIVFGKSLVITWKSIKTFFVNLFNWFKNIDWDSIFKPITDVAEKIKNIKGSISGIGANIKTFGGGIAEKVTGFFGGGEKNETDINITVKAENGTQAKMSGVKKKSGSANVKTKLGSSIGFNGALAQ